MQETAQLKVYNNNDDSSSNLSPINTGSTPIKTQL